MKHRIMGVIVFAVLILTSLSCQVLSNQAVVPSTATAVPEQYVVTVEEPSPTEDFSFKTQEVEANLLATEEAAAQATSEAAFEAAAAETTRAAAEILAATAEVEIMATSQAQDMANAVEALAAEDILQSTAGTYYWMEDFNESWAQIGWYQWWSTGLAPTDFVLSAHTEWESASRTANWFDSGCGFVFHETDEKNHYMIFLALDGNVYLKGYVEGKYREFGKEYFGKVDFMKGGADVMLAVQGPKITYLINGKKVFQRSNNELKEGNLALTLVSGTNKDYGTRCTISDIKIWDLTNQ